MMQVALIRHGKTQGNLLGKYIGRTDEALCPEGRLELEKRKKSASYPACAVLFVSPLLRCRQTADLLYPEQEQILLPSLRESDFGEFENQNYASLKDHPSYQRWLASGGSLAFPGGESRAELCSRSCTAFYESVRSQIERKKEPSPSPLSYIIHGGTIMAILEAFARPKRGFYEYQLKNGEGFLLELNEMKWTELPVCCILKRIGGGERN